MTKLGYRIFSDFERLSSELIRKYESVPVANIADNMGRFYAMDSGIRPFNESRLVGSAFTVKSNTADNLLFHKALDLAKPGDVIVVDVQGDCTNAVSGEVMVRYAMKKGIKGFVIDGAIRDVDMTKQLNNFSVYAKGVNPKGPYKFGPGEINVPISCGGVVVNPGDLIVGDQDGIVVIPKACAESIYSVSKATTEKEQEIFNAIENGTLDRSWIDEKLIAQGFDILP